MFQALTLNKKVGWQWMLECSPGPDKGPYCSAVMALQVAAIEYARRRKDAVASIFVKDNYGTPHKCKLVDELTADHCLVCENSWAATPHPLPPRCPLWEALRGTAPRIKVEA